MNMSILSDIMMGSFPQFMYIILNDYIFFMSNVTCYALRRDGTLYQDFCENFTNIHVDGLIIIILHRGVCEIRV